MIVQMHQTIKKNNTKYFDLSNMIMIQPTHIGKIIIQQTNSVLIKAIGCYSESKEYSFNNKTIIAHE